MIANEHVKRKEGFCLPESLKKWREKNNYKITSETLYENGDHPCKILVKDLKGNTENMKEKNAKWENLDKQIKNDEILKKYPKV